MNIREITVKAKRIVTRRADHMIQVVCFEYDKGLDLEDLQSQIGGEIKLTIEDSNGEFTTEHRTALARATAPNRGNWGAPDDVLLVDLEILD